MKGGVVPAFEARVALSAIELPRRSFRLEGTCATGSGTLDVAMYNQSAGATGTGYGAGVGGRVGLMLRSPPSPNAAASWWGLRADLGFDIQAVALRVPTQLPAVNGAFCSDVAKTSHAVAFERAPALALEWPLTLGVVVAIGRLFPERWSGILVGLGWRPSLIYVPAFSREGDVYLRPLGLELNVDVAVLRGDSSAPAGEPHVRLFVSVSPGADGTQPTSGTLGAGASWY